MSVAYGYIRVSTAIQAESELGLLAQQRMIRDYAKFKLAREGIKLETIYSDPGVSAYSINMADRPQGAIMLANAKRNDHIIVAKLDRAFRSVSDFAKIVAVLHSRGVHLHLLDLGVDTSSAAGRMVATIMASIAEWEARRIGERIRDAVNVIKQLGYAHTGPTRVPIGWSAWPLNRVKRGQKKQPRRLRPCERERRAGRLALSMRNKGCTYQEIGKKLTDQGVRTRTSGRVGVSAAIRFVRAAESGFPSSRQFRSQPARKLSQLSNQDIVSMRLQGMTLTQIANKAGVSRQAVNARIIIVKRNKTLTVP